MRISIMQPYFFPYAGYFRLLAMTDIFIFLDDVQFPRTGWVHRNKFEFQSSKVDWLTLPLVRGSRDSTQILDLVYRQPEEISFRNIFKKTKYLSKIPETLINFTNPVVEDLVEQVKYVSNELGYKLSYLRSSEIPECSEFSGQEKIIQICKIVGANRYLNLNGGKDYYDVENFRRNNIKLEILTPFGGEQKSVVDSLYAYGPQLVRSEISRYLTIE